MSGHLHTATFTIGTIDNGPRRRRGVITVNVRLEESEKGGTRLAIDGDVKRPGARDIDEGGQLQASLTERANADEIEYAEGWDYDRLGRLVRVWEAYHLNDMRASCAHQALFGWHELRIDEDKPADTYGQHFPGQVQPSWNLLGWVRPAEHPSGLLGKPCPVCGYEYGTEWKTEELPDAVIEYIGAGCP